MSKEDFLKLMKDMSNEKSNQTIVKKNSIQGRKLSLKNTSIAKKSKANRDEEESDVNYVEDEDEQKYNDVFKKIKVDWILFG